MERHIEVEKMETLINLFGSFDENIRLIEKSFDVAVINRGSDVKIGGEPENVDLAIRVIQNLIGMASAGTTLGEQEVRYVISQIREGNGEELETLGQDCVCITSRGTPIRAKTLGQKKYVETIEKNSIVFGIGPAGTGKTYLAVAMAVKAFKSKEVNKIILTRPAVEAGESLGFLPGDMQDKVDPYLRPLYDALGDMLGGEAFHKNLERGLIEVAPLAYMRGRTLDHSFIILDEAQNTTQEQLKMFLTRLGEGSKAVVTGDVTQIDLPPDKSSGLKKVKRILNGISGISFIDLTEKDVVRCELVQKIIKAYEKYEKRGEKTK